ncbi:hypothetical protein ACL02U_13230 [Streptomyces sp. MS06]|uniref:hypothetical protein n=1 Tax=Streptomyces sp. MS06 TaxID=3385974 RepID=UPI0039A1920C
MGVVWNGLLIAAGVAVAAGAGVEAYALRTKRAGDTLSEHIRPWAKAHRGLFLALCGLLVAVGAWLPGHILGGS